ncbi:hypothetical protein BHF68_05910 [Desulfuribacillus alkaliarsenatis]|uniref:AAA+ ATPase domain-containing protein n=1 Tax=Desulfuribacillus alkaliarsenatis TaxID=766136 RepID=A0A1E5G2K5_9FIRM|nr:hypothetical protein BHF68_05910 [Desulfuribacillus alkaliarsenatis]
MEDWVHYADYLISFYMEKVMDIQHMSSNKLDKYKGLVVGREEMLQILDEFNTPLEASTVDKQSLMEFHKTQELIEAYLAYRARKTIKEGVFLPLLYMSHMLKLNEFEQFCVVLSLLPHIDKKYEKIFAYLQDDITRRNPTADLAIKIYYPNNHNIDKVKLLHTMERTLYRYIYIEQQQNHNILNCTMQLDQRLREFIMDINDISTNKEYDWQLYYPGDAIPDLLTQQDKQHQLLRILEHQQQPTVCFIFGPTGSGKQLQVKTMAKQMHKSVVFTKTSMFLQDNGKLNSIQIKKVTRETLLHDALLCLTDFDEVRTELELKTTSFITELLKEFKLDVETLIILSESKWHDKPYNSSYYWIDFELDIPDRKERSILWQSFSEADNLAVEITINELANKFQLTPGQIINALNDARATARWQGDTYITRDTLYKSCYKQINHKLATLASLVLAKYEMEDLILPTDQKRTLTNACNHVKYRHVVLDEWGYEEKLPYGKGLSMLFAGPPGTGKTMAAQVIAQELGLEMYKIDLSQIISKYIGETEKNLQEVFNEAQKSNAILFFDECDAILGKRTEVKDSHDRYANIETSYLLQKIEEFAGVSVLATNYITNIDNAFLRRIQYVLHFPFPDEKSRELIWRGIFPGKTPVAHDVDFSFLAKQFELAGGNIKNIAVNAAFLAAAEGREVSMKHIILATKDEVTKQGKVVVSSDFGEYGFYLRT